MRLLTYLRRLIVHRSPEFQAAVTMLAARDREIDALRRALTEAETSLMLCELSPVLAL